MKEICVIEGDGFRELVGKLDAILEAFGTYKKNEKKINEWLTQQETKEVLRVSSRTLQNYRDNGALSFSKVGRKIKYKRADVESLLQKHYVKGFAK
jgi:excisionase family DNA binding protein